MNKHLHRIIFNANRGQLMVVAESATAQGKAASGERSTTSGGASTVMAGMVATLRPVCLGVLASLGMVLFTAGLSTGTSAQAQIVADRNAPGGQRPTVLTSGNGVPVINIQTPSAGGVSRNTYSQFDVNSNGVILNNSRVNTPTQLGGYVQGNPWLATGSARVILNEVNSSSPSQLRGYIEVGGQRAEVIVANPAGVAIDGAGFINASRVTITTGSAQMNGGSLEGYLVQRGQVTINGKGLDTSSADYTAILARAVQVNGGIWAKELNVTTGANQISATEGSAAAVVGGTQGQGIAPLFALDVSQLGGMYAGKILLIGTESGVGVRSAGTIGASAGQVQISVDGMLTNSGSITSTGNTTVDASGGINNSGTVYAQGNTAISTRGDINNTKLIAALGNVDLSATGATSQINSSTTSVLAAGLNDNGTMATTGQLSLNATQSVTARGQNLTPANLTIQSKSINLADSNTSAANLTATASTGDVDASRSTAVASQSLILYAAQTVRTDAAKLSATKITLQAHDLSNVKGEIVQTGQSDLSINLVGDLDNSQGRLATNSSNMALNASTLRNTDGKIEHAGSGKLTVQAQTLAGAGGTIASAGALSITGTTVTLDQGNTGAQNITVNSATLSNRGGNMIQTGTGPTSIQATTLLDNTGGTIASNGHTQLTVGKLNNQGGTVQAAAQSTLTINATGDIANTQLGTQAGTLQAGSVLSVNAQTIDNTQGRMTAGDTANVNAAGNFTNARGLLAATQATTLSATAVNNQGGAIASVGNALTVTARTGSIDNTAGTLQAAQALALTSQGLDNTDGTVAGQAVIVAAGTGALDNTRGTLSAATTLTSTSGALTNNVGLIQAGSAMLLNTQGNTLTNSNSGTDKGILGQSSVTLQTGDLVNQAGFIGAAGNLTATSGNITNSQSGVITSQDNIALTATGLSNQGGQIQAAKDLAVNAGAGTIRNHQNGNIVARQGNLSLATSAGIDNSAGILQSTQAVNLASQGLNNTDGTLAGQTVLVAAGTGALDNTRGTLSSATTLTSTSGALTNNAGLIQAGGAMLLNTQGNTLTNSNSGTDKGISGQGSVTLRTGDLVNQAGFIGAGGDLNAVSIQITNSQQSVITSKSNIDLTSTGLNNQNAQIQAAGNTTVNTGNGAVRNNQQGSIVALDGTLAITTSAGIDNSAGILQSTQAVNLASQGLNNADGTVAGKTVLVAAGTGALDNTRGTLSAVTTLTSTSGALTNNAGLIQAGGAMLLNTQGNTLTNSNSGTDKGISGQGSVTLRTGDLVNQAGFIGAAGNLTATSGNIVNSQEGVLTSKDNVTLTATSLSNQNGQIQASGNVVINTGAGEVRNNLQASIVALNGTLAITTSAGIDNSAGTLQSTQAVNLTSLGLNNTDGTVAGQAVTVAASMGALDNTRGTLSAATTLTSTSGALTNNAGVIQAGGAMLLNTQGNTLTNSNSGADKGILGQGSVTLQTGNLVNQAGFIGATGDLTATSANITNNQLGVITSQSSMVLTGSSLSNHNAQIQATQNLAVNAGNGKISNTQKASMVTLQGALSVTTSADIDNSAGTLQSRGDLTLTSLGLNNTDGTVAGQAITVSAGTGALDNTRGTLSAATTLTSTSGAFTNNAGLIQAGGALLLNTQGNALTNSNSGTDKGILGQSSVTLRTGDLVNQAGFIGAAGNLTATSGNITNSQAGVITSKSNIDLTGTGLNNQGGQIQAKKNLTVNVSNGTVNNQQSLLAAGQTLAINAASIDNRNTLSADPAVTTGIEGNTVVLNANTLNNTAGAVRADQALAITGNGNVNNSQGLLSSAGSLTIADTQAQAGANNAAKTQSITNTGGKILADVQLTIDSASLTGDGKVLSRGDLNATLLGNYTHQAGAQFQAVGNASLEVAGTLTNQGQLLAGDALTVKAANIDNTATGEIYSNTTSVIATNTVTNRGLIDGGTTSVQASTINNIGTGRIYGDTIALQATTLNNDAETVNGATKAAAIAARGNLDIGVGTLNNREGALIFSAGNMTIGGSLDANKKAIGAVGTVTNSSATIESLGNLTMTAANVNNTNAHFSYTLTPAISASKTEYITNRGVFTQGQVAWTVARGSYAVSSGTNGYVGDSLVLPGSTYASPVYGALFNGPDAYKYTFATGSDDNGTPASTTYNYEPSSPIWSLLGVAAPTYSPNTPPIDPCAGVEFCFPPPGVIAAYNEQLAIYTQDVQKYKDVQVKLEQFRSAVINELVGYDIYRTFSETTYTGQADAGSKPAYILSGANMTLNVSNSLANDKSQIIAGGLLTLPGKKVNNIGAEVSFNNTRNGTTYSYGQVDEDCDLGGLLGCDPQYGYTPTAYTESTPKTLTLGIGRSNEREVPVKVGDKPKDLVKNVEVERATIGVVSTIAVNNLAIALAGPNATPISAKPIAVEEEITTVPGRIVPVVAGAATLASQAVANAVAVNVNPVKTLPTPVKPDVVVALVNAAATPLVVRTAQPNTTLPNNSLFRINPNPTTSFFVETDPRYTNYRQWLSSDYLLAALGLDPATTQKRLGDGFYEQKLIREQVALLTGRRFTGDFTNDEAQYSALMQNAATYAKAHQLRPGIALSEAQMAQLTADIVWLVEKTITLPNGQTVKALVPQVYVRVQPGDITGEGTLIAAERVNIQLSGDLTNSGTIAGRSVMRLSADNVNNLGGRLAAADNTIIAKNDINNVGGVISANDRLQLNAGRDINVTTTTGSGRTAAGVGVFERTSIDRVAGLYVSNPNGVLVASAGRDINLTAAVVQNTGKDGSTVLDATRNLTLATVKIGESSNVTFDAKNYARFSASQEVGTQIQTGGNLLLKAGQDITAKAATIASQDGTTALVAGRDVTLTNGQETFSYDKANQSTSKGFLSKTTTTTRETRETTTAIGSAVEGKQVLIQAGNTIRVTGSSVASDTGTTLIAGNNLIVESAQNTTSSSSTRDEKKSGLMTTGSGASLGISLSAKDNRTATRTSTTQVGSSITSATGATTLIAQEGVLAVIGSNVSAADDKQLTLQGKQVVLSGALNSEESTLEQSKKSTNMHFGVVKPSEGMLSRGTLKGSTSSTNVAATTLSGGNVSIKSTGEPGKDADGKDNLSGISLAGVKITTPGTLALDAGKGNLAFNILETTQSSSLETTQRDIAYQKAKGAGTSDGTAVYNELSYGKLAIKADTITVQTGVSAAGTGKGQVPSNIGASSAATPAQLKDLASKPGMSWVNDVAAQSAELAKTNPAAALHIQQVQLAHNQWDYKRQGLTKEGAAIVSLVVAYFTAGAGSGIAGAAGMTTTTVTAAGVATTTLTAAGTVVAAVAQAAITSLASQASVSMVNNQGNLSAVLKDLGSSDSVKGLLTAMVTAGALSGLNLAMANTGLTSTAWNSINATSPFMDQLQKNLVNQLTTNVLQTALTGGNSKDYEKGLQTSLLTAFITTGAAQGANAIGDMQANGTLNALTHKLAHAIAGCAAGAASASVAGGSGGSAGSGCGSGAIGAVIGEITAQSLTNGNLNNQDIINLSKLMSGLAAALVGGDVNLAATAGGNAAENNALSGARNKAAVAKIVAPKLKELDDQLLSGKLTQREYLAQIQALDIESKKFDAALTLAKQAEKGQPLTSANATKIAQLALELSPAGTPESIAQLITGKESMTGEEANRFWAAIGCVPMLGGGIKVLAKGVDGGLDLIKVTLQGEKIVVNEYKIGTQWADKAGNLTWLNPLTNKIEPFVEGSKIHVDHILPQNAIKEARNFNLLPADVQQRLLNDPLNLQPMLASANCSKGCKVEGTGTGFFTWNGLPVDAGYGKYLAETQAAMRAKIEQEIAKLGLK
jgi:filamentous hemagglutinin